MFLYRIIYDIMNVDKVSIDFYCSRGKYNYAHILDYPSVSHINYVAQMNSYVVIFMVTQEYKVI